MPTLAARVCYRPHPRPVRAALVAGALALVGVARPAPAQEAAGAARPKLIVVEPSTADGTTRVRIDGAAADAAAAPVRVVTPADAAAFVRQHRGRPTAVVLYGAGCSRSKQMLPALLELARRGEGSGATVLAFGVNGSPAEYAAFHAAIRVGHDPLRVRGRAGDLTRALAPLGIAVPPGGFSLPLVAVLDADGQLLGQWEANSREATLAAIQSSAQAFGVAR